VTAHAFCDHNLAIILTFAVLEFWLIQSELNCEQLFLSNVTQVSPSVDPDVQDSFCSSSPTAE